MQEADDEGEPGLGIDRVILVQGENGKKKKKPRVEESDVWRESTTILMKEREEKTRSRQEVEVMERLSDRAWGVGGADR